MGNYESNNICAIITIYNIGNDIHKSLNAIYDQVSEIILVDDGSDVKTLSILKSLETKEKITVLYNKINSGISAALNKGVKYALSNKYSWILTLDQDSIVSPNMVRNMLFTYDCLNEEIKSNIMIMVPHFIERGIEGPDYNNKYDAEPSFELVSTEITSGNLVKAELYNKVGMYNEDFFIDFVDIEFCLRIKKLGYFIAKANNSTFSHNIGNSKRHKFLFKPVICTNHNFIRRYYITRNRLYLWKDYLTTDILWVLRDIRSFIGEIIKIILWEDTKFLKMRMILRGLKDFNKRVIGKIEI